jgi:hypothetical protein
MEVQKIEDEIIKEKYPISWDEVDERREKVNRERAKKKTLNTLTKSLSKGAKEKYEATHMKSGKAPKGKLNLWNRVLQNSKKRENELNDEEKHEIVAYIQKLKTNRKMKIKDALKKIGLDSWKYYRWRKKEGLVVKCKQCKTSNTPQWRQYKDGMYCNACGIKKYRKGLKKKNRGKK